MLFFCSLCIQTVFFFWIYGAALVCSLYRRAVTHSYTQAPWASLLVIQCQIICLNKVSHCCTSSGFMWAGIDSDIWGLVVFLWRAPAEAGIDGRWATLPSLCRRYCSLRLRCCSRQTLRGNAGESAFKGMIFIPTCNPAHQSDCIII